MTNRSPLYALLLISALIGVIDGHFMAHRVDAPGLSQLVYELILSFACFVWYCRDSDARHYSRSRWLSVAMVGVTWVAMPYYLWRSRPAGQRGRALWRCFGFGLLLLIVTAVGTTIGVLLA